MEVCKMIKKIFFIVLGLFLLSSCDKDKQVFNKAQKPVLTKDVSEIEEQVSSKPPYTNKDGYLVATNGQEYFDQLMYELDLTQEDLDNAPKEFYKVMNEFCSNETPEITIESYDNTLVISDKNKIEELKNIFRGMKTIKAYPFEVLYGGSSYGVSYYINSEKKTFACTSQFSMFRISSHPKFWFGTNEKEYESQKSNIEKFNKYFDENAVLVQ
jgi:hypothetical protein